MLTQERVQELLEYNPVSGVFLCKERSGPRSKVGEEAGMKHHSGYRYIQLDGKTYAAHRLAFLYVDGYLPESQVDHINRVRDDNRYGNLREASRQCNTRNAKLPNNNTTGIKGVHYHKQNKRWVAHISVNKVGKYLGIFDDLLEAAYHRFAAEQCLGYTDCDMYSSAKRFIDMKILS